MSVPIICGCKDHQVCMDSVSELLDEVNSLKSLLGKERDEFGKMEGDLMVANSKLRREMEELVEALKSSESTAWQVWVIQRDNVLAKHTKPSGSSGAGKEPWIGEAAEKFYAQKIEDVERAANEGLIYKFGGLDKNEPDADAKDQREGAEGETK